ncbi:MAG: DUF4367 domain-containing protein [Ruminiclostridium sp.]
MLNEKLINAFDESAGLRYNEYLSAGDEHRFSLSYRLNRKKIIKVSTQNSCAVISNPTLRLKFGLNALTENADKSSSRADKQFITPPKTKKIWKYIAVAAIIGILTITVSAIFYFNHISLEEHDIFSMLHIQNIESAPMTIKEKYEITADLSGFEKQTVREDEYELLFLYNKEEICISFTQMTFEACQGIRINTEGTEDKISSEDINGITALYFETNSGEKEIVWDNGEYIFMVGSYGISKDELIKICNSVAVSKDD